MEKNIDYLDVRGSFCLETRPGPCGLIIFGASGDLTYRKLLPALFNLHRKELLPNEFYILGFARTKMTNEEFRKRISISIMENYKENLQSELNNFIRFCGYYSADYYSQEAYIKLSDIISKMDEEYNTDRNHIFYFATPPDLYCPIAKNLNSAGLTKEPDNEKSFVRVVIEKPFGHDLNSAIALDKELHLSFSENQIYRIDHYLGKETVQNILMFRFANAIFEPIWDRRYIDNVQITVAESIGVEHRAGYFERAGLLRDMFQNHILQMLALVAMEPPTSFDADRVRDERVKLLRSLRPFPLNNLNQFILRGQYNSGFVNGKAVPGYRHETNVSPDSNIETFISAKVFIDNWRWQGVPFYIRTGKRLARKVSKIVITFRRVPHSMFAPLPLEALSSNVLIFNVQPEEGIALTIQAKQPGSKLCMSPIVMDFYYKDLLGVDMPDAYERLLLDCMVGDQTLFWRSDDVESAWSFVTPVLDKWKAEPQCCPLVFYEAGSWGPKESYDMIRHDGREWHPLDLT